MFQLDVPPKCWKLSFRSVDKTYSGLLGPSSIMQVDLSDGALHTLIETYCREAGVRNLQKHIEKIYRKVRLMSFNLTPDLGRTHVAEATLL